MYSVYRLVQLQFLTQQWVDTTKFIPPQHIVGYVQDGDGNYTVCRMMSL